MVDFKSRQEDEIEKLSRTLKSSRLATSESEARRMAEEMLGISKKVADDFKKREQQILGDKKMNAEQDLAHKQMEMLAANIASGKSNARLDLSDLKELDVNKPLKDLIAEQEEPVEKEEDDAVEISQSPDEKVTEVDDMLEPAPEQPDDEPAEEKREDDNNQEAEEADVGDDSPEPDDDEVPEEEKAEEASEEAPVGEASDPEAAEEDDSEGVADDFSVKELDSAPVKSDNDRKREIQSMEESKIDLSNVFNANR